MSRLFRLLLILLALVLVVGPCFLLFCLIDWLKGEYN